MGVLPPAGRPDHRDGAMTKYSIQENIENEKSSAVNRLQSSKVETM